jgi:hypothetical protein
MPYHGQCVFNTTISQAWPECNLRDKTTGLCEPICLMIKTKQEKASLNWKRSFHVFVVKTSHDNKWICHRLRGKKLISTQKARYLATVLNHFSNEYYVSLGDYGVTESITVNTTRSLPSCDFTKAFKFVNGKHSVYFRTSFSNSKTYINARTMFQNWYLS